MSFFFNPPPVAGPISVDLTFSEFFLKKVGEVRDLPLDKLEQGLKRENFTGGSSDTPHGVQILACDRIGPAVTAEIQRVRTFKIGPILVIAARSRNRSTDPWDALGSGADDFLLWDETEDAVEAVAARLRRWREVELAIESLWDQGVVVGRSRVWRRTLAQIVEAAKFGAAPVLIMGETGTGKELLARCVHALDPRAGKGELVLVDGATLNPELSGSELFGHEKGAFTGAVVRREGALARAHQGTLFLDEVGEIAAGLQGELLRAVQEGVYKPVGGDLWRESRFRLVCATNRDLEGEVKNGAFRQDLFFRIAGSVCRIPPLRERREDIPLLVERFLKNCCPGQPPALDPSVAEFLMQRDYPGNVRDLKQVVARLLTRYPGHGPLTIASIPEQERPPLQQQLAGEEQALEAAVRAALAGGKALEEIRKATARKAYSIVLAEENGDTARAAWRLKVSKRAVQMFVKNNLLTSDDEADP